MRHSDSHPCGYETRKKQKWRGSAGLPECHAESRGIAEAHRAGWPDGRSAQRRILVSNRPSTGSQVACIRNGSGNGDAKRTCTELEIAAGNLIDSSLSTASGTVNSIMRIRPRPVLVGSRRWWQRGSRSLGRAMAASVRMRLSIVWGGIEMYIASHLGNTLGFGRTITVAEDNR